MGGVGRSNSQDDGGAIPKFENVFSSFVSELTRVRAQVSDLKREKESLLKTISEKEAGHVRLEVENSGLKEKEKVWIREKEDLVSQLSEKEEGHKLEVSAFKDKERVWIREKEELNTQIRQTNEELEGSRSEARKLEGRLTSIEDQLEKERAKSRRVMKTRKMIQLAKKDLEETAQEVKGSVDRFQKRVEILGKLLEEEEGGTRDVRSTREGFEWEARMEVGDGGAAVPSEGTPEFESNQGNDDGCGNEFYGGVGGDEDADVLMQSGESPSVDIVPSSTGGSTQEEVELLSPQKASDQTARKSPGAFCKRNRDCEDVDVVALTECTKKARTEFEPSPEHVPSLESDVGKDHLQSAQLQQAGNHIQLRTGIDVGNDNETRGSRRGLSSSASQSIEGEGKGRICNDGDTSYEDVEQKPNSGADAASNSECSSNNKANSNSPDSVRQSEDVPNDPDPRKDLLNPVFGATTSSILKVLSTIHPATISPENLPFVKSEKSLPQSVQLQVGSHSLHSGIVDNDNGSDENETVDISACLSSPASEGEGKGNNSNNGETSYDNEDTELKSNSGADANNSECSPKNKDNSNSSDSAGQSEDVPNAADPGKDRLNQDPGTTISNIRQARFIQLKCPDCNDLFEDFRSILLHRKNSESCSVHYNPSKSIRVEVLDPPTTADIGGAIIDLSQAIFICGEEDCDLALYSSLDMARHGELHGDFRCDFCNFECGYAPDLAMHELEHSMSLEGLKCEDSTELSCPHCQQIFPGLPSKDYVHHYLDQHLNLILNEPICPICKTVDSHLSLERDLLEHLKTHHDLLKLSSPEQKLECGNTSSNHTCVAYFLTEDQLKVHEQLHHKGISAKSGESVSSNCPPTPTPDLLDCLGSPQNQNCSENSAQVAVAVLPVPTTTLRRSSRTRIQTAKGIASTLENEPETPSNCNVRRQREPVMLEAAVNNFRDAKLAVEGGANSLLLFAYLTRRGEVTPSLEFVTNVIRSFPGVEIWIMIRPSDAHTCDEYNQAQVEIMIADMERFKSLDVEGFAFGALDTNSEVDEATCRKLIAAARPKKAYFHQAFDNVPHGIPALDTIINLGFDRVMTGGLQATAVEGVNCLKELMQHGANLITVTMWGGLTPQNVLELIQQTGASSVLTTSASLVGQIRAKIRSEFGTGNDE